MRKSIKYLIIAAIMLISLPLTAFAQIDVSLPELTNGGDGDTVMIPITVGSLTGQSVESYQFTLSFDKDVVNVYDYNVDGTLSSGSYLDVNTNTDGQISVAVTPGADLSGVGTLGNLCVELLATGESALTLGTFIFNEGTPAPAITNGLVTVNYINVSIPDVSGKIGEEIPFAVTITEPLVTEFASYDFTLKYDETLMEITGYDATGTLSENMFVEYNDDVDGQVSVSAAQDQDVSTAGVLLNFTVKLIGNGESDIMFDPISFDEGNVRVAANTSTCSVSPVKVFIDDLGGKLNDTLLLPIEIENITDMDVQAYSFTLNYDESLMNVIGYKTAETLSKDMTLDLNDGSGTVTVVAAGTSPLTGEGTLVNLEIVLVGSGDGNVSFASFVCNEGTPGVDYSDVAVVSTNMVGVYLPTETYSLADTVLIPVTVEDIAGTESASYTFSFDYDPDAIEVLSVVKENTLSSDMFVEPNLSVGNVIVSAAGSANIEEDGTLINIKAVILVTGSTSLEWNSFTFNEGSPIASLNDGELTLVQNVAPVFTMTLPDTTIAEALTYTYAATDANGDLLTFALVDAIEGMTVSADGELAWTPTNEQAGEYTVVVSVTDGAFVVKDTAVVTVTSAGPDLFFSQYIEGSSFNKAIEIYNGTGAEVDLSNYVMRGNHNGSAWEEVFTFGNAKLADGDVYVICHSAASAEILAVADTIVQDPYNGGTSNAANFNGDDVRALCKVNGTDTTIIDIFGASDLTDPGSAWDVAGVEEGTKDHTLVRKSTVTKGNPNWTASAGTNADDSEWIVLDKNTFEYLGNPYGETEVAGVVSVTPDTLQVRFTGGVALDVDNFEVDGAAPTAVTMVSNKLALLTINSVDVNTDYVVTVKDVNNLVNIAVVDTTVAFKLVDMGATMPYDKPISAWEDEIGNYWAPTGSGSTWGIQEASSFAISDEAALVGTKSAKLNILNDPARKGWYVRLYNHVDKVKVDSKIYLYLKGTASDVQIRLCVDDDGTSGDSGYEMTQWYDISVKEDDWQVISLDISNDPVFGWVNGDGQITSTDQVTVSGIHLQCKEDIDAVFYMDMFTERQNLQPVEVTLQVDMTEPVTWDYFDATTQFVDVAGSFNGWSGTTCTATGTDNVFEAMVGEFYPGETLEYKFRIDGSWDDDKSEFAGGGPNRVFVVGNTDTTVSHFWYDRDPLAIEDEPEVPATFALEQNYPNPFNPTTNIKYQIPENAQVKIVIYDVMGKVVRTLVNEQQSAGYQSVVWDARNNHGAKVSTGVYIYHMQANNYHQTHKMMLVK